MSDRTAHLRAAAEFLHFYSWIYSFRWISPTKDSTSNNSCSDKGILSVLNAIPSLWLEALTKASFYNLKALVTGKNDNFPWPQDLRDFAANCIRFTRLVSQLIQLNPDSLLQLNSSSSHLINNHVASCIDFVTSANTVQQSFLHMSPKKSHEVSKMTAFIEWVLQTVPTTTPLPSELSNRLTPINELPNDGLLRTFQTCPLTTVPNTDQLERNCLVVNEKAAQIDFRAERNPFPFVVDIGSGLGHFANSVARRLLQLTTNVDFSVAGPVHVFAVDCDPVLDRKASDLLKKSSWTGGHSIQSCADTVRRILYRLMTSNTSDFRLRLKEQFSECTIQHPQCLSRSSHYLLCGLHCCGDLSQAIIRLFAEDNDAEWLVLVGCCYHKMTLTEFPTSGTLRDSFESAPHLIQYFRNEATFRLACQWSPLTWLEWSEIDFNMHRVRLISRILLSSLAPLHPADIGDVVHDQFGHFDPIKELPELSPMIAADSLPLHSVLPLLSKAIIHRFHREPLIPDQLESIWNLTPGLLALQQLMQPLLEVLILADRVWSVRETVSHLHFSGLVRLFDPQLSPRCIAFVARKCTTHD